METLKISKEFTVDTDTFKSDINFYLEEAGKRLVKVITKRRDIVIVNADAYAELQRRDEEHLR